MLFASNRVRRPFSAEAVSLLGSLAALAAVSLVQTRALAETRATSAAAQQAAEAHDRFTAMLLEGGGVENVTAVLHDLLGGWVVVLDADGRRTSAHGPAPAPATHSSGTTEPDPLAEHPAVVSSTGTGRLAVAHGVAASAAAASGERLGTLVLGGRDDLSAGEQRIVERAAVVAALVLLFRRQAAEAEQRVRRDLLSDLLTHDGDPGPERVALAERARLLGIGLDDRYLVAVCHPQAPTTTRSLALSASSLVHGTGMVAEHRGDVVLLVAQSSSLAEGGPSAAAPELARRLDRRGSVTVGVAGPVVPLDGLAGTWTEARRTTQALRTLGTFGRGAAAADLGFAGLVVADRPDIAGYLRAQLGPVLDYDTQRGTDLLATLDAYFAHGGSPRRAAGVLHVHVNTVTQRLDRVRILLGKDWHDPERSLELQLALRLRQVLGNGPSG